MPLSNANSQTKNQYIFSHPWYIHSMHSFLTSIFIWTEAEVFFRIFKKILQLSTLFIQCLSSMS